LTGLTNLIQFQADTNQLTGPIPPLTGLTKLTGFFAKNNQLTGTIPDLTGLTSLQLFVVGNNKLTGPVPASPAGLLANLSALCPNPLDTTPSANDVGWDAATGYTPWWAAPYANNQCDDLFTNRFGD
jgi:Leucine-rich repeat (LRR) protein